MVILTLRNLSTGEQFTERVESSRIANRIQWIAARSNLFLVSSRRI